MKSNYLNKIIKLFVFLLAVNVLLISNSTAFAKKRAKVQSYNAQDWLVNCNNVAKVLEKGHFRYSNGGTKGTLKKARRHGKRSNCALYVSWCLQEFGATNKGTTFYTSGSGRIRGRGNLGRNVTVLRKYCSVADADLQIGDVVCFKGVAHTAIYAGKSEFGNRLWYDGGKSATNTKRSGGRYRNIGARHVDYLNRRTVSYIIRIKGLH